MNSGERFKQLRRNAGLTQRAVGDALGVTDQTISNWEAGRTVPNLKIYQAQALCRVLQCSIDDIPDFRDIEALQSD